MAAIQTKRRDTERIQNRDFILTKYDRNSDYDEHFPQFSTEWYKTVLKRIFFFIIHIFFLDCSFEILFEIFF